MTRFGPLFEDGESEILKEGGGRNRPRAEKITKYCLKAFLGFFPSRLAAAAEMREKDISISVQPVSMQL